ncbi:MAG: tRNA lysidine(34) synthetase TilS, partial [Desulfovibrionaceae bacterium]
MPPAPRSLQELPPHWAHFCLGLERFAAWRLGRDFRHLSLVVGFSAGADSSALLQALVCLADRGDLRLTAVHLDHGLRPESADDAAFAARACAELGVELAAERVDVAEIARRDGLGLEDAGRRERYALFERVRAARGADLVCTAHQLNDLAEDVLLRLARGTA